MFGFVTTPAAKVLAAFIAAIAIFSYGYYKGYTFEKAKYDEYVANVNAIAKAQEQINAQKITEQERITQKAKESYEKSLASIRSTYAAIRMRSPAGGSALSSVPDSTSQPAEAAAHYISVAPELAVGCAETTQQLIDLQSWVTEQGGAK